MFALPLESRISYLIRTNLAQVWPSFINSDCPFRSGKPLLIITHSCDADCISQTVQAGTYLAVPRFVRLLSPNKVIVRMHPTPSPHRSPPVHRSAPQPCPPSPAALPAAPRCSPLVRLPAPQPRSPPRAAAPLSTAPHRSPARLPQPPPRLPPRAAAPPASPRRLPASLQRRSPARLHMPQPRLPGCSPPVHLPTPPTRPPSPAASPPPSPGPAPQPHPPPHAAASPAPGPTPACPRRLPITLLAQQPRPPPHAARGG